MNHKQTRHLPAFLLLFLAKQKMYGNQLIRKLETIAPDVMTIDPGGVYRALREMEKRGAITSEWMTEGQGAPKRMYTLTEQGRAELDQWYEDILGRLQMLTFFTDQYERMANQ